MKKRRFAIQFGLCVVVAVATTALSSSAAARSYPAGSHLSTSGKQVPLAPATTKQARALVRQAMARVRSLQASGSGVICIGGVKDPLNTDSFQKCTFSSGSAGACIQRSTNPDAQQICAFTQPGVSGRANIAIVLQIIVQRAGGSSAVQNGSQTANVDQQNTTKANLSFVSQIIKQSIGRGAFDADNEEVDQAAAESKAEAQGVLPNFSALINKLTITESQQEGDEPAETPTLTGTPTQDQQSQQTVDVCQGGVSCSSGGMTGTNLSGIYQSLRQRERAAQADTITQSQNKTEGPDCPGSQIFFGPNTCATVNQGTLGGQNFSGLWQLYRQFQSARYANHATQQQDAGQDQGGFDHNVNQTSTAGTPGYELVFTDQRARQVQRARNIPGLGLVQTQDPRGAKGFGSEQIGSVNDQWFGTLIGIQIQAIDGVASFPAVGTQNQLLSYDADSLGKINVLVRGVQNGSTAQEQCTDATSCHKAIQCDDVNVTGESEGYGPGCFPVAPPVPTDLYYHHRS